MPPKPVGFILGEARRDRSVPPGKRRRLYSPSPASSNSDKSADMVESCADEGEDGGDDYVDDNDDAASRSSDSTTEAAAAAGESCEEPDGSGGRHEDNEAETDRSSQLVGPAAEVAAGRSTTLTLTPATVLTLRKAAADMRSTIPLIREAWGHVIGFCGQPAIHHDFRRACGLLEDVADDIEAWARGDEDGHV